MKQKKKEEKLRSRQAEYDETVKKHPELVKSYTRPGSVKK